MATVNLKGNPISTRGDLPDVGQKAPDFTLTRGDLQDVSLNEDYAGKRIVLNIVPSLDTGICAKSLRRFNELAASLDDTVILNVSRDLPFAVTRFCGAEGIDNAEGLSSVRDGSFGKAYGVDLMDGPMAGLFARAVVVLDADHVVRYTELVDEITTEPDYDAALSALQS